MAKYIPLDALVAEIKRRISLFKKEKKTEKWSAEASQMNVISLGARIAMLEEILSLADTLEMKEVDLEKEIQMFSMDLAMKENNGDWEKDIAVTAKHFFKLGMAVSNKAQKGE